MIEYSLQDVTACEPTQALSLAILMRLGRGEQSHHMGNSGKDFTMSTVRMLTVVTRLTRSRM